MIELYQAEWCPFSHAVRQRLTELDVTYVIHQAAPNPEDREEVRELTGDVRIPALRLEDGTVLAGDTEEILARLDEEFAEPPTAEDHRRQAAAHEL